MAIYTVILWFEPSYLPLSEEVAAYRIGERQIGRLVIAESVCEACLMAEKHYEAMGMCIYRSQCNLAEVQDINRYVIRTTVLGYESAEKAA